MLGQWVVRDGGEALLARVQNDVYVLAFSSATRAARARQLLGADGSPFLIVAANVRDMVAAAQRAGALGFIVDYDAEQTTFSSAHPLPETPAPAAA